MPEIMFREERHKACSNALSSAVAETFPPQVREALFSFCFPWTRSCAPVRYGTTGTHKKSAAAEPPRTPPRRPGARAPGSPGWRGILTASLDGPRCDAHATARAPRDGTFVHALAEGVPPSRRRGPGHTTTSPLDAARVKRGRRRRACPSTAVPEARSPIHEGGVFPIAVCLSRALVEMVAKRAVCVLRIIGDHRASGPESGLDGGWFSVRPCAMMPRPLACGSGAGR